MMKDNPAPPVETLPGVKGGTTLPFQLVIVEGNTKIRWDENGFHQHADRAHQILWNEYRRLYDFVRVSTGGAEPGVMGRWREMYDYIMQAEYDTSY